MRSTRLGVLIGVLAIALTSASTPAWADDTSSICSLSEDGVLGSSPAVVGVRVQAFDCAGDPVAFTGTMAVQNRTVGSDGTQTLGAESPLATITSPVGAPAIALVDVGDLDEGEGVFIADLRAAGESATYHDVAMYTGGLHLGRSEQSTNQPYDGRTHAGAEAPFGLMKLEQDTWGCVAVLLQNTACVLDQQTRSDQTWQKGYKITMSWPDPGADDEGRPYQRCMISPSIGLFWHDLGAANPIATVGVEIMLDVPAGWGSYTLPLAPETSFPGGVVPGSSTIDVRSTCYSTDGAVKHLSAQMTASNQLIPDLPPTQPSDVSAEAGDGALTVTASGSETLGAAQLEGYDLTVVDATGEAVAAATVPAPAATSMRTSASRATALASSATAARSHRFIGLEPGTYTIRATAFNRVGSSDAMTSRVVTVKPPRAAAPLTAPRRIGSTAAHRRIRIHWVAPASTGGGVARYTVVVRKGTRVVQRASVRPGVRTFITKRLTAGSRYRVVLTVVAKDGRTRSITKQLAARR